MVAGREAWAPERTNKVRNPKRKDNARTKAMSVFVTNGGYGAVNQALSMGVPLVVAGDTEDKAFVAARVAWTGAGISLGTSRPTSLEVRYAVREVLRNQTYRNHARRLQNRFADYNALDHVTGYVESYLGDGGRIASQQNPYQIRNGDPSWLEFHTPLPSSSRN